MESEESRSGAIWKRHVDSVYNTRIAFAGKGNSFMKKRGDIARGGARAANKTQCWTRHYAAGVCMTCELEKQKQAACGGNAGAPPHTLTLLIVVCRQTVWS